METVKEFLRTFQPEIDKYRAKAKSFAVSPSIFDFIPGYQLFETDLNSLLEIYESPLGLKNRVELPLLFRMPFDELAIISHLSLKFKDEITNRDYFVSNLFRGGKSYNENPYPAIRFSLFLAYHLRTAGNTVGPKFLNGHRGYDMLVITPDSKEIEIECKTQSDESGKRIDRASLENMMVFLREAASSLGQRLKIHVVCDEAVRSKDIEQLIPAIRASLGAILAKPSTHKMRNKTFQVSIESLGKPADVITTERMFDILKPYMEELNRIGIISRTPFPDLEDFSFVAIKSKQSNRPLTNLVGHFAEASDQLTGKKPGVLVVHHDADVNVQKVAELANFRNAIASSFGKWPKISGFVYSSMDVQNPSGFGYPFGSLIAYPNTLATNSIEGVKIPGLFN